MKLTAIILLVGFLQVSARTTAQERISISLKSAPLEKVFVEIEKRSGYTVFYNVEVLKYSASITIDMKDATVDDVMRQCLKGLPLEFSIQDKTVFVKHDNQKIITSVAGPGTDTDPPAVSGVVKSEAGLPLTGATIYIPKLKRTGITNIEGEVILKNVPNGEYKVEISYVGYERYITTILVENRRAKFVALMKTASNVLDQTVVIPYGTTTNRLNTGDVSTVTSKEIEDQPVSNPLEAIEGRVPGLLITQTTGLPGGGFTVQIRGQNSIASGNNPFYVIDGVPYSSQLAASPLNGTLLGGNPLNFISPNDIESIEILKDADATAIYGSRAANGAILITTKKGQSGAMKFDFNVKSGSTNPARTIPLLITTQYLAMRHEAFNNDGVSPIPSYAYDVNGVWDSSRNENWPKILANKAAQFTDAQASISGGTTNTQYLIGTSYIIQKTGFPTLISKDGADRKGSFHFNLNTSTPDKKFKITLTGSYLAGRNSVQSQDLTNLSLVLPPDAPPITNSDGSLNWAPIVPGETGTWANPYAQLYRRYVNNTSNLVGNTILSYTLLHGLELKASLGYTNTQSGEVLTVPTTTYDPGNDVSSGSALYQTSNVHSWIIEPQANYRLHLGRGVLNALAGASFLETNTSATSTYATGFVSDALLEDEGAASNVYPNSASSNYKYEALFARLGYDWMDKYLVNLNVRRDGSSRFGPGKQYGDFGAVGAAWIFTQEDFIRKNLGFLSFGKIRGSYGTTGNDQVGDYGYVDLYNVAAYPYQNARGLIPANLNNPLLAWETTKKLEGAIELGFFKDRVMIQGSLYRNRSGNELVKMQVSAVTGFSAIPANLPALVQNAGKEFTINTINIRTKHFKWVSSLNVTIARNKLVSYPNLATSPYANTLVVGHPLSVLKLFHEIGVNDTTGVYEFASPKTGPTYNPDYLTDNYVLFDPTPKYYGGLQNNFTYKGFTLAIFFQFVKQNGLKLWAANGIIPGMMYNQPTAVLNRWQRPGDIKPFEQFTQNFGSMAANGFYNATESDFAYGDASFIRLKNLAFSWEIPQAWAKKSGLTSHIYIQCQNLLTITKYDGMDPESKSASTGPRRGYSAGLQIGW